MDWALNYLNIHVRYSGRKYPGDDNLLSFALQLACDVIGASIGASLRSFVACASTRPHIIDTMVSEDDTKIKQGKSRDELEISYQRDASISNRIVSKTKRKQHLQLDLADNIVAQEPTIYSVNGLRNKGQTCYANSVFQAMAALPSFCMYLQQLQSIRGTNLGHELNQTIQYINGHEISFRSKKRPLNTFFGSVSSSSRPIKYGDPCKVLDIVARHHSQFRSRNGMFVGTLEQQDAHEFFIALMDVLSTEHNRKKYITVSPDIARSTISLIGDKYYNSGKSSKLNSDFDQINRHHQEEKKYEDCFDLCIQQKKADNCTNDSNPRESTTNTFCSSPFDGWLGSTIKCNSCQHIRPIRSNPFVALSLSLANTKPTDTIENCIEGEYGGFATAEQVSDVLCRSCAIKKKLNMLEEEELLLKGAISNIKRRTSPKMSKPTHAPANDLVELVKEVERLRAAANQLKSLDADADEVNLIDNDKFPIQEFDLIQIDSSASSKLQPIRVDAWKANLIMRQPKVLCIHIQRRHFDYKNCQMMKFRGHVAFSEIMALSDFCSFDHQKQKCRTGNKLLYKLMSVIEHQGGAFGGHYQTYRRSSWKQGRNTWVLVSDMSVSSKTWNDVKKCQAYMLFYVAL